MVAHKILVTSPEAKFLFSLFGAFRVFGLWTGPWPRACQFVTLFFLMKASLTKDNPYYFYGFPTVTLKGEL